MVFMMDNHSTGHSLSSSPPPEGPAPAQPSLSIPSPHSGKPPRLGNGQVEEPSLTIPPLDPPTARNGVVAHPKIPLFGAKMSTDCAIGAGTWMSGLFSSGTAHAGLVGLIIWTSFPAEDLQYGASKYRTNAISVSVVMTQIEEAAEDTNQEQQAAEALVAQMAPPPPPEPEKKEEEEQKPKDAEAMIEKKEEEKKQFLAPPPTAQAAYVSGKGVAQTNQGRVSASYGEERAYGAIVRARIARRKPAHITRRGTTVVKFTINGVGDVTGCRVWSSSGDREADDASVDAVRESAPFPPPPPEMAPVTYAIPFHYF